MEHRKTLTMNWDGLGDVDEDDAFFESYNRLSSVVPLDLASSSDDDDDNNDFDDPRMSFVSAVSSVHPRKSRASPPMEAAFSMVPNYDIWMASPDSITERRKRLLHGMGLDDNKEFLKASPVDLNRTISNKFEQPPNHVSSSPSSNTPSPPPPPPPSLVDTPNPVSVATSNSSVPTKKIAELPSIPLVLVRSRSEGDIDSFSLEKLRREEIFGEVSKQRLTRTTTNVAICRSQKVANANGNRVVEARDSEEAGHSKRNNSAKVEDQGVGTFFLIKNLDTGKEFIVNEYGENGVWNKLSELQTGKQLTMEEFEKTVGQSRVVNEVMRRANGSGRSNGYPRKLASSSYISRSLRLSKKRGAALLKNLKGVASGFLSEREKEAVTTQVQVQQPQVTTEAKNQWIRVRQNGKTHKEFSALYLCQEFQAHEGCIWTIKFSLDGHFLASGGEDKVVHVWEVQECGVMSLKPEEGNPTPLHPSFLEAKKAKSGIKRWNDIPDYVHVPETIFSISENPYCSFQGHNDEVLDLSWSKSHQWLLSSSMDKTVRLWDLKTKTCLKMFTHNDYVTSVQFNPMDDDYFISGSLDAKVRIWNIPERHVVDWTDIHEMVTAVSYTHDAQGAFVGTHKGSCRTYSTKDCVLSQTGTVEIRRKKKSQLRKVTGFQFVPGKASEVLVTSADSRIRILDGSEVVQKYQGFRNANSQIAASFSRDGRYIICASEDSQVYIWKHEEHGRSTSIGKGRNILVTRSHEHFQCKDVSIAISWPGQIRGDPPLMPLHSKRHSKRIQTPSTYGEDTSSPLANSKTSLPPLPKKSTSLNTDYATNSPKNDHATMSGLGYSFTNSKKTMTPSTEEEDPEEISPVHSGFGDSFSSSSSSSARYGNSPSISTSASSGSWFSSYSLLEGSHGSSTIVPSAWGLVIVTAGYGGEIRCYQNFGLPRRMQPHLF